MSLRSELGLPPKTRLESAIAKSDIAISFLMATRDAALAQGNHEMLAVAQNALDAVTELRLLVEERRAGDDLAREAMKLRAALGLDARRDPLACAYRSEDAGSTR